MTPKEFRNLLRQTLEDHNLSRSEKRALKHVLDEVHPAETHLDVYRHEAFELARTAVDSALDSSKVIDWLEDVIKLLKPAQDEGGTVRTEAHFSPGNSCRNRIRSLLRQARHSVDICVFTITDNEISDMIAETHRRGVDVRIISDNDKSDDTGSDIDRLSDIGVPVRVDRSPYHMHHKFALFDQETLLCGSYNWTRSAADNNEENIVIANDRNLVKTFSEVFEKLWKEYL